MGRTFTVLKKFWFETENLNEFQKFMSNNDIQCWIIENDHIIPSDDYIYDNNFERKPELICDNDTNTNDEYYDFVSYRAIYELCLIIDYQNNLDEESYTQYMVIDYDHSCGRDLVVVKVDNPYDYYDYDTNIINIKIQIIDLPGEDPDVVYNYTWNPQFLQKLTL